MNQLNLGNYFLLMMNLFRKSHSLFCFHSPFFPCWGMLSYHLVILLVFVMFAMGCHAFLAANFSLYSCLQILFLSLYILFIVVCFFPSTKWSMVYLISFRDVAICLCSSWMQRWSLKIHGESACNYSGAAS